MPGPCQHQTPRIMSQSFAWPKNMLLPTSVFRTPSGARETRHTSLYSYSRSASALTRPDRRFPDSPISCARQRGELPPRSSVREEGLRPSGVSELLSRRNSLLISSAILGCFAREARASDATEFYGEWVYIQPSDILPFIYSRAEVGDEQAVVKAIDEFGRYYPMYKCGDEKGKMLEEIVSQVKPNVVLELGSFLGYSSTRMAGKLPTGARIITVEAKPENAKVAEAVVAHAGHGDVVQVLGGRLATDALMDVRDNVNNQPVDLIFMDHFKDCYLPDLKKMEALGLLHEGTVVVADNVVYPGAPGYLEYVDSESGHYETKLLPAMFEYNQSWKEDWTPKMDALSVSVYRGKQESR